ncbi:MAG: hypothetical protein HXY20_06990 [Acidobacteria bacterium]|nr:hypothetical protein [Acidobacteriota bacterium]
MFASPEFLLGNRGRGWSYSIAGAVQARERLLRRDVTVVRVDPGSEAGAGGPTAPSQLKITDMRAIRIASNYDYPIVRIDTNQGVYGLGEVRDAGNEGMALVLKPHILGRNPLQIEPILDRVRNFANQRRFGGGYSALDTGIPKPIIQNGYIRVPDSPGLGVELNEEVCRQHLRVAGYFEPTPQYDKYILDDFRRSGPYPHLDAEGKPVIDS